MKKDGGAEEANADLANQELLDISEEDIETVGDEIASNDSDVEEHRGSCTDEWKRRNDSCTGKGNTGAGKSSE